MRPVRSHGVKGKWKGRSIASNALKGRCMAEPTLTFYGCAFFMWPRMTRMSWISLTSSLIVLCLKQATRFTKSGGEPIFRDWNYDLRIRDSAQSVEERPVESRERKGADAVAHESGR